MHNIYKKLEGITKQMKILHIDTGLSFRGGQRQAKILHLGLLKSGVKSFFLANKNGTLIKKLPNSIPFDYKNELSINTHKEFVKVLQTIKPDIVQTHDGHAVALGSFHKKLGYKLVETRRVSYSISFISRVVKYSKVDLHIAVSEEIKQYLAKYFKKVVKISSCIEFDRFKIEKLDIFKDIDKYHILFVGAFTKQKGIDILIKAFKNIDDYNLKLHMVGDGELLNEMKSLARDDKRIVFYGRRDDVEQFYLNSSLVIVPSVDGEGSSGVIKEAIVAGKIVIASDLNANQELITDGLNGIIFKKESQKDLQEKIESIISKKISIDYNEIKRVAGNYSCNYLIKKYLDEYQRILV